MLLVLQLLALAGLAQPETVMLCDVALAGASIACAWNSLKQAASKDRTRQGSEEPQSRKLRPFDVGLWIAFGFVSIAALWATILQIQISPMGDWDAWIIWNLKSRFAYLISVRMGRGTITPPLVASSRLSTHP